jgi:hypothetical protein
LFDAWIAFADFPIRKSRFHRPQNVPAALSPLNCQCDARRAETLLRLKLSRRKAAQGFSGRNFSLRNVGGVRGKNIADQFVPS